MTHLSQGVVGSRFGVALLSALLEEGKEELQARALLDLEGSE